MTMNGRVIRLIKYVFILLVFATTIMTSRRVTAQQPVPSDDEVNAIARQLYCPICENIPLDVCPTDACRDWRELIRQMLAEGKTPDEIKQYFVDHYGARVLSQPPWTGLNWLVYVVPLVVIPSSLILLFFMGFTIWRKTSKRSKEEAKQGPGLIVKDDYALRLEEELRKRT